MSDDEIVFETLLILIGGDETTRHTLGGTDQLLRHPDQWERLIADEALVPGAVEEMLRWTSPVKNMARTVLRDNEFHGTGTAEGEKMLLLFESANFDESTFGDPENFRIDRAPNSHLAFGFGTHFCLGNQLARLELTTMLRNNPAPAAGPSACRRFCSAIAAGQFRQRARADASGVHPCRRR